ncbi:receptor-like serine/threonine-protein kinase NCRK isoform X1 [Prunus yedoensis var. nudiflora]|uniref:non-specific serine/threonine protein kinase n=1 Tax=Prunus yedoensis var. nudiflora TaxID=2094558 RepID=A0A314V073_PRUYE|nr:receptor-like serine/threonine-protein kinase NCRK isoform X1 [Prunus yedoensis var. nudiflora]
MDSPINKGTGCFTSCLFKSKIQATPGAIIQFSYFELESATDKFSNSNLIGLGGSSYVYRGQLKGGRIVAVKRLKAQQGPDSDSVFITEIEMLSRLHHYHVVPLLGYCFETHGKNAERLLVFEYMNNGNLRDCLDGDEGKNIDWGTRVAIAIGAARGLEYLHEAAAPRILHRDVKSTNILLDENWQAKITDLGMAKRLKADGLPSTSSSPARMQGTFGYFAPEYAIVGRASLKSDVFSFGVVLLELITGRKPIHKSSSKGEESLVIWATPRLQDSRRVITELADPDLAGNFPEEEMQIMAYLAKECLLLDPDARPNMSEVVQILSTIVPERSKRRNFPINLFQHMGTDGHKDAEELRRARSSKGSVRCSLPLDIDRNLCAERRTDTVSDNYMERLILLTSNARSWRASDDETVDLTEPREMQRGKDKRALYVYCQPLMQVCPPLYQWPRVTHALYVYCQPLMQSPHLPEMDPPPPPNAPLLAPAPAPAPPPYDQGGCLELFLWMLCCCGLFRCCCPPLFEPGPPPP